MRTFFTRKQAAPRRRRYWRPPWPLSVIVLIAVVFRFWSLDWQLPHLLHSDELKYAGAASYSAAGLTSQPPDYRNPSSFRHLLDLEYRLLPLFGETRPISPLEFGSRLVSRRVLIGRWNAALFGVASVALLYWAGRRAVGPVGGLAAAALLAVNFLHVHLSHYSLNDVPAVFLVCAALVPTVHLLDRPTRRAYLLAGFLGGLAAATKYNAGIVLVTPVAAILAHLLRRSAPPLSLLLGLGLLGLGALGGFLVGMPETPWAWPQILDGMHRQSGLADRRWTGQEDEGTLLLYARALLQGCGPAILALAGFGVVSLGLGFLGSCRSRCRALLLVLTAGPLAYLAVMLGKPLFFARFALPLVPFVSLLAAAGLALIWTLGRDNRRRTLLTTLAALLALAPPAYLSLRLDLVAGEVDTRVQARRWIQDNLLPGTRLAAQSYSLPIIFSGDRLDRDFRITNFYRLPEIFLNELVCAGNRYILISSYQEDRQAMGQVGEITGYEAARGQGVLVAAFLPGHNQTGVSTNVDDDGLPYWHLTRYARPGPTIEVYALPPRRC